MAELEELLDIVDKQNNVTSQATRQECYQEGLLHRAVNIFIFNSQGEVFLQQRSDKKLNFPLYWDISASEHVLAGEDFEAAAKRGLKEELGIETPLVLILPIHRIDNRFENNFDNELLQTYKGIYDQEMKLDLEEVSQGKFFKIDEVDEMIKRGASKFTPWFLEDWNSLRTTLGV